MNAKQGHEGGAQYRVECRHFRTRHQHTVEADDGSRKPKLLVSDILELLGGHRVIFAER
jgi:hypothetical protein